MSVLRRGQGRCVGRFPVLLVPWQFFRLADAVRCTGHCSALHRLLQRAALGFAARCVRLRSALRPTYLPSCHSHGGAFCGKPTSVLYPLHSLLLLLPSVSSVPSSTPYIFFCRPSRCPWAPFPFPSNHTKESSPIQCSCGRIGLDSVCGCDVCDRAGRRQGCSSCLYPRSRFIS